MNKDRNIESNPSNSLEFSERLINTDRLVRDFINLTSISSESGHEENFAKHMMDRGTALGLDVNKDEYGNVYLFLPGEGEAIMLNTHMDTVAPGNDIKASVSEGYVVSDGTTVLGADSKAGIAAMLEMVKIIKDNKLKHRPVLITLSCNEESGIPTADKIVSDVKICVVPDRGTPIGELIIEAPYDQVFEVNIKGKSVYAPTSYDNGNHAVMAAINFANSLTWGNQDDDRTTTSIGIFKGGESTSMVPAECYIKVCCYTFDKALLENFLAKSQEAIRNTDSKIGTKSELNLLEYFGGFKIDKSDPLVKLVENAMEKSGITPSFNVHKAVTNANLLNQIGIKTVLISTGVENQHTTKERISIDSLRKISSILTNIATS